MSTFRPTDRAPCGSPTIHEISLNRMSLLQFALLELHDAMLRIRIEANRARLSRAGTKYANFDYLYGQFCGVRFGFASALIFMTSEYDLFKEQAEAFNNEASFLIDHYAERGRSEQ